MPTANGLRFFPMSHITSEETISKLQKIFSRFGLLETLVSDNGTAFNSVKFSTFCQQNGINHIHTPPFHPQSKGQVERLVDTFKRALSRRDNVRNIGNLFDKL